MSNHHVSDNWERGSPYERYIGRWSRQTAPLFLSWLNLPPGLRWLDLGCGTGALSAAILDGCAPQEVTGVEPSEGFMKLAAQNLGTRARFLSGDALHLPLDSHSCDAIVSGLVLNFIPDVPAALREMQRVVAPGGTVAAYVWDYAGDMEIIKAFWDVAVALDPAASPLHEGSRFPLCAPEALKQEFEVAGLQQVKTAPLDQQAAFEDFDDYWSPFLGGQGPAPSYVTSLSEEQRTALREGLRASLQGATSGNLRLNARAWAVRGSTPLASASF